VEQASKRVLSLDLSVLENCENLLKEDNFSAIIHAAALARSSSCEENPAAAYLANVQAPKNLASAVSRYSPEPFLIYFSTDLVFDGRVSDGVNPTPSILGLTESDLPKPHSVYAKTKLQGEKEIISGTSRGVVFRTSLIYGAKIGKQQGFLTWILSALDAGTTLNLFTDEWRTPILTNDISDAVVNALKDNASEKLLAGDRIFHLAGPERVSRYEFGLKLAAEFDYDPALIVSCLQREHPTAVPRPQDVSLCSKKINSALNLTPTGLSAGLKTVR